MLSGLRLHMFKAHTINTAQAETMAIQYYSNGKLREFCLSSRSQCWRKAISRTLEEISEQRVWPEKELIKARQGVRAKRNLSYFERQHNSLEQSIRCSANIFSLCPLDCAVPNLQACHIPSPLSTFLPRNFPLFLPLHPYWMFLLFPLSALLHAVILGSYQEEVASKDTGIQLAMWEARAATVPVVKAAQRE